MQVNLDYVVGATLVVGCMCTLIGGYLKGKLNQKDEGTLSELVNLQGTEVTIDCHKPYSCLSFESMQDFVSSFQYLVGSGYTTYIKSTVYDNCNKVLAYNYVSKDGNILVTTGSTGNVSCCKFKGTTNAEKVMQLMHSKLNKSSFCYKDTSDGFVLEPSGMC